MQPDQIILSVESLSTLATLILMRRLFWNKIIYHWMSFCDIINLWKLLLHEIDKNVKIIKFVSPIIFAKKGVAMAALVAPSPTPMLGHFITCCELLRVLGLARVTLNLVNHQVFSNKSNSCPVSVCVCTLDIKSHLKPTWPMLRRRANGQLSIYLSFYGSLELK